MKLSLLMEGDYGSHEVCPVSQRDSPAVGSNRACSPSSGARGDARGPRQQRSALLQGAGKELWCFLGQCELPSFLTVH